MRIVFAGTPSVAVASLDALHASGHEICCVITRDDAPLGRKRILTPSPVAARAVELGLPVVKANRLDDAVTERITKYAPDLGVIVAYGGLVREPLLSVPSHGWVNLHFSSLPSWRGAAPVQRALIAGEDTIGLAVFQLTPGLDEGDVWLQKTVPTGQDATAGELLAGLASTGAQLLVDSVRGLADGSLAPSPQSGEASYAHKLSIDDGHLDLSQPAETLYARFRGVTPEPGAYVLMGEQRFKIREARLSPGDAPHPAPGRFALHGKTLLLGASEGSLALLRVQPAGKPAMAGADWWRGVQGKDVSAR
ncbi:methionyl-tRNA formyltransferase [Paramicrobacterium sp. CJ85]|uniref:methionyl-tRNA formyltransferase n=1 Tax=Paramicrobacterium sp. CJ85 TaxID=3445355 RepID=UPI003F646FAC